MSSETEILLSIKAVYSALGELAQALERGGFVGGDSLTNLGYTNLVNQDPSNPSPLPPSQDEASPAKPSREGREVFEHWVAVMGKTKGAKFDRKRQRAVAIQLKLGRSVAELKRAVDGCALDPFSMGDNDRAQVFNDFCLIFRDAAHVEKFMAIADGGAKLQLRSAPDPAKLRADANAERRKTETQRLLERQQDLAGRTDSDAAKKRLAELAAKVGKDV